MEVKEAISEYHQAILRHSPRTQQWYIQKLEAFAVWCSSEKLLLEKVRPTDIRRYLETLRNHINPRSGKPLSSYTVHGYAQVIKGFLAWCAREDGIEDLVSERVSKRIDMPKVDIKVIETFTPEMIRALFAATEKECNAVLTSRDKAMLSLLFDTGIRASELCDLTLDNVHLEPFDSFIKVFGKGRKEREVGLGDKARSALKKYITRYRKARPEEMHVFISRYGTPMTVNGVDQMFSRLGEWARITTVRCSPHTARHTYAIQFLLQGGDVYVLSRLLGHHSVTITETYLRSMKGTQARKQSASVLDSLK